MEVKTGLRFCDLTVHIDTDTPSEHPLVARLLELDRTVMAGLRRFKHSDPHPNVFGPETLSANLVVKLGTYEFVLSRSSSGGIFDDLGGNAVEGWVLYLRLADGVLNFESDGLDYLSDLIADLPIQRVIYDYAHWEGGVSRSRYDDPDKCREQALRWVQNRKDELEVAIAA